MPTGQTYINLDYEAATRAQAALQAVNDDKAARNMDTVATNALGVLQEMGVYSCFLFLFSRRQGDHKTQAAAIRREMLTLLYTLPFIDANAQKPSPNDAKRVLEYITTQVTSELDRVLLTRQVFEQMLLYVRYGAAALKADN